MIASCTSDYSVSSKHTTFQSVINKPHHNMPTTHCCTSDVNSPYQENDKTAIYVATIT